MFKTSVKINESVKSINEMKKLAMNVQILALHKL